MLYLSLKVSKSQKQFLKFSFAPKNERKHFCISALAYKKRSNQKSSVRVKIKSSNLWYKVPVFFRFDLFFEARAEIQKKNWFVFLVQMKTSKFAFEIY